MHSVLGSKQVCHFEHTHTHTHTPDTGPLASIHQSQHRCFSFRHADDYRLNDSLNARQNILPVWMGENSYKLQLYWPNRPEMS